MQPIQNLAFEVSEVGRVTAFLSRHEVGHGVVALSMLEQGDLSISFGQPTITRFCAREDIPSVVLRAIEDGKLSEIEVISLDESDFECSQAPESPQ